MRWLIATLLFAGNASAAEVCVQSVTANCCHALCDLPWPTTPAGYSTEGVASCGAYGEFVISTSSTDPTRTEGGLSGGSANLFLWVTAGGGYGFSPWSEVTIAGNMPLWQFTPLHPAVTWDVNTPQFVTSWTFSAGCIYDPPPTLLASMVVLAPPTGVEGPETDSWGRIKALWR